MMQTTIAILFFGLCLGHATAEPLFETTRLFPLTPKNRPNYRIPSIIQAPNGDILVICERRNDGPGDIGNHDIVMKRSADKGKTWSQEITILDDENRVCTDLTVGLDRETKKLWLFFLKDKKQYAHLTSTDNGLSWQGPVVIHDQVIKPEWQTLQGKDDEPRGNPKSHAVQWEKGWVQRYGCGPGNAMIQLKSGRLLVPARHREDIGKGRLRSFAHSFYSDDHGTSWHLGGTIGIHTSECQFVELTNGDVRVISRNESSEDAPDNLRHLTAISKDGGVTWSGLHRLEELITPRCHGPVERFDAKTLLFSSPASPFRQKEHPYGRYNLTVRLSHDDGETWTAGKTIWPHPGSYSDLVVLDDHTIGYIYERADKGSTHYWDELHFARFNLEWLTNSKEIKDVTPTRQVVYKKVGDRELNLEIFEPAGLKTGDKRACFVSIHGGGWTSGSPRSMYSFTDHCAKLGMVAISVQYRLYKAKTPVTVFECVKDARAALRYVRAHAAELGIDPHKIIANGASAGGHLAAATAMFDGVDHADEDLQVSCHPDALVLFSPVIDTSLEGYGNAKIGERWQELSPAHQVHAGLPPTLLFHGTGDATTPFKGAQLFTDAMRKANNTIELVAPTGAIHTYMFKDANLYAQTLKKMDAFLTELGLVQAN